MPSLVVRVEDLREFHLSRGGNLALGGEQQEAAGGRPLIVGAHELGIGSFQEGTLDPHLNVQGLDSGQGQGQGQGGRQKQCQGGHGGGL